MAIPRKRPKYIKKCTFQLENTLGSSREFLIFLEGESLISEDIYTDLRDPRSSLSKGDKAYRLVSEIRLMVEIKSENYHTIMKYLRSKDQYRVVEILDREYGGGKVSYNFLHLTLQEFFAAYHISQLSDDSGLEWHDKC